MWFVLSKSGIFVAFMLLAYGLKCLKLVPQDYYKQVSKVVLNFTLPCAVLTAFANFERDDSLWQLLFFGILTNLLFIALAFYLTKGETRESKIFYGLNMAGYNVGTFALPFAQMFLGSSGVVAICMFDIGNAIMCTGGTFAFYKWLYPVGGSSERPGLWDSAKVLLTSVPFMSYILMLILVVLGGWRIPAALSAVTSKIAILNGPLAMVMLGLMFEITWDKQRLKLVKKVLLFKYLGNLLLVGLGYLLLPVATELKVVLAIALLAPIPIIGLIFMSKLECDIELASLANSLSIVLSVICITGVLLLRAL